MRSTVGSDSGDDELIVVKGVMGICAHGVFWGNIRHQIPHRTILENHCSIQERVCAKNELALNLAANDV